MPWLQLHEQHDAHIALSQSWPIDDALEHLRQLLDLAVDLRRADAHAAGIEHRVRAAIDDDAAMLGQLDIVAMAPDVGEALEIGGAVFLAVGVVPESDRHRGEGRGADQLALLAHAPACPRRSRPRPSCRGRAPGSRRARPGRWDCRARSRRRCRCRRRSRTGRHPSSRSHRRSRSPPAPAASRWRRWCAAPSRSWRRRSASASALAQASMYFAEVPKKVQRSACGEVEQDVAVGMERRAVIEQQRRARGQRRDQPVPHHPAAGGEVEHAGRRP